MGRVYSDSTLDAFAACQAKGLDTLKPRHSKEGASRQGQAWHKWSELYVRHLRVTRQVSDLEEGRRIWNSVSARLTPDDEDGIAAVVAEHLDHSFAWYLNGTEQAEEESIFVTLDRQRVPPERVHELTAPVFRFTADLRWRGDGPHPISFTQLGGDGVAHILDWKTHHHVEHVTSPSNNRQLRRYAAALYPNDDAVVAWLAYPRRGYFEHAVFSKSDLDEAWQTHVVTPIKMLEARLDEAAAPGAIARVPERVVGAHCRHCDLFNGCDAAQRYPYEILALEQMTPEEKLVAKKLAERIVEALEESLRGDLADRGEITDGASVMKYIEKRAVSYDAARVVEVLIEHMTESQVRRAFAVTKTSIDNAMKEAAIPAKTRKALLEACAAGAPIKISTSLHTSKVKEERDEGALRRGSGPAESVDSLE